MLFITASYGKNIPENNEDKEIRCKVIFAADFLRLWKEIPFAGISSGFFCENYHKCRKKSERNPEKIVQIHRETIAFLYKYRYNLFQRVKSGQLR